MASTSRFRRRVFTSRLDPSRIHPLLAQNIRTFSLPCAVQPLATAWRTRAPPRAREPVPVTVDPNNLLGGESRGYPLHEKCTKNVSLCARSTLRDLSRDPPQRSVQSLFVGSRSGDGDQGLGFSPLVSRGSVGVVLFFRFSQFILSYFLLFCHSESTPHLRLLLAMGDSTIDAGYP